jgi:hypothetical protein
MTLGPTVGGGLKLIPEEVQDWLVLLEIAADAHQDLASSFAKLMDEDAMWDEIVVPELETEFGAQKKHVLQVVRKARRSNQEEIIIDVQDADLWYGALNQARLSLENQYRFGAMNLSSANDIEEREARSAYLRNDFYLTLQSLILRYIKVN